MAFISLARFKHSRRALFRLGSALALVSVSAPAYPQTVVGNVMLPQAPQFQQGQDRIRAADGTECSRSTGPRKRFADVGMLGGNMGGSGSPYGYYGGTTGSQNYSQNGGAVYGRITFNLDPEQDELQCSRLYELELERLRLEVEQARLMGSGKPVTAR